MTPDVNVLVAASRDDHGHHRIAHHWLIGAQAEAARGTPLTLLPMIAAGFVRVVTHSRVFADPTPVLLAMRFLRAILDTPGARMATLGTEWSRVEELCTGHALTGNDVPDAWIAAAVLDQRERLVTFDRGFRRLLGARDLLLLEP